MEGFFQRYIRLYRPLINTINEILSEYDLSYSLWQVIYCVKHYGPTTLVEIAKRYNVEKPTITRRVNHLEERQLIKKVESRDKREKLIRLTESGEKLYSVCRVKITEFEIKMLDDMSEKEIKAFFQMLSTIQQKFETKEGNQK